MIRSGRASLVVTSTETEPEAVSQLLAMEPSEVRRKGTALRSGRIHDHHVWSIDVGTLANTDDDQTGTRVLRELLDRSRPATRRIQILPADCEVRIWWSADSDSGQGGFVLPADLVGQIAELGVDLYGTVYLEDDEPAEQRE